MRISNALLMNEGFLKVLESISTRRIPMMAGLELLRAYKALAQERSLLIEARNNVIRIHGVDDGKGGMEIPETDTEAMEAFQRECRELLAGSFELPITEKIRISAPVLDKSGNEIRMSLQELEMVTELIEFVE